MYGPQKETESDIPRLQKQKELKMAQNVAKLQRYLGGDKAIAEEKEKSHLSRV